MEPGEKALRSGNRHTNIPDDERIWGCDVFKLEGVIVGPRNPTSFNEEVYQVLSNSRRLQLIRYLSIFDIGASVEVRQIARTISGLERGIPPRSVGTDGYESVYNGLIQNHLPTLATEEVIEYDAQSKKIIVTPKLKRYATADAIAQFVTTVGVDH